MFLQYGIAHCSTQSCAGLALVLLSFAMQDRARLRSLFCFASKVRHFCLGFFCLLQFRVRLCNPLIFRASLLVSYSLLYHVHGVIALRRANFLRKHVQLVVVKNLLVNLLVWEYFGVLFFSHLSRGKRAERSLGQVKETSQKNSRTTTLSHLFAETAAEVFFQTRCS